ncbi:MAG: DUF302 domain-containing protein [Gammaproteobacteria bacterium]|nr:DUF302 domain-containing protein [Gammaproteobacteria bacterium]
MRVFPILFLFLLSACDEPSPPTGHTYTTGTDKEFPVVIEDLEFAITERNYRIVNTLEIGKAIRERGASGFPENTVILFCNLSIAQSMLEQAPEYLDHCPARISVRQTDSDVLISGHLFPESGYNQALDQTVRTTNTHIIEIINYASRKWPAVDGDAAGN